MSDQSSPAPATLSVTPTFFPLMWILFLIKPKVVIDGQTMGAAWKQPVVVPVQPGQHRVEVYFPYIFPSKAGLGTADVVVQPGQTVSVTYKAPWLVFLKGKMIVA